MEKVIDLVDEYRNLLTVTQNRPEIKAIFKNLISEALKGKVKESSGTLSQSTVHEYVRSHNWCTARNISSALGYDIARINFHLGQLVKKKLIRQDKSYRPSRYFTH